MQKRFRPLLLSVYFTYNKSVKITAISDRLSLPFLLVGLLFGFFFIAQYKTKLPRALNPVSNFIALESTEKKLDEDQASYQRQIVSLQTINNKLQSDIKSYQTSLKGKVDQVDKAKALAGFSLASGQGVSVLLDDSPTKKGNPNSIAHAADMRDLTNYLWQHGAKGISITGQGGKSERVGFDTSIDCIVNTVLVNDTKLVPPFAIEAIGDRNKLVSALSDKVALVQIYDRVRAEGLVFQISDTKKNVALPAYTGNSNIKYVNIK